MADFIDMYKNFIPKLNPVEFFKSSKIVWILPLITLIGIVIVEIRNRQTYNYKVRIYKTRESGKVKEINCKGGYIGRKNSAPFFRIQMPKFFIFKKNVDLTTTPNPAYIDEEDRIYYKLIDVGSYVQCKRIIDMDAVKIIPVETDVKYGAILSIQRIKEALRTESTWKKIVPYASVIVLGIIFIIAYAMLMDTCSG